MGKMMTAVRRSQPAMRRPERLLRDTHSACQFTCAEAALDHQCQRLSSRFIPKRLLPAMQIALSTWHRFQLIQVILQLAEGCYILGQCVGMPRTLIEECSTQCTLPGK